MQTNLGGSKDAGIVTQGACACSYYLTCSATGARSGVGSRCSSDARAMSCGFLVNSAGCGDGDVR
eukprot:3579715-Amphidinium_carterae.1